MAQRPILGEITEGSERSELENLEWVVAKMLLDANAHTVEAFESHLLRTYREDTVRETDAMLSNIERAIDEHEQIIEELEVAAEALAELES